jgi:hypothetical protein
LAADVVERLGDCLPSNGDLQGISDTLLLQGVSSSSSLMPEDVSMPETPPNVLSYRIPFPRKTSEDCPGYFSGDSSSSPMCASCQNLFGVGATVVKMESPDDLLPEIVVKVEPSSLLLHMSEDSEEDEDEDEDEEDLLDEDEDEDDSELEDEDEFSDDGEITYSSEDDEDGIKREQVIITQTRFVLENTCCCAVK